jgi:citrate synthase
MSNATPEKIRLVGDGIDQNLPVVADNTGRKFIDISGLYEKTRLGTYDPGFANTAACMSQVSNVDGEAGRLLYRGYSVEDLVANCTFVEVASLLIHGKLPNAQHRAAFSRLLNEHSLIHEDMRNFFRNYPEHSHPMAVLSAMVVSLSSFYPELEHELPLEAIDMAATRLISKVRTIAAFSYKKSIGQPSVYPRHDLDYCSNFLNMMFSSPVRDYRLDPVIVKAMNQLLIIHADHSQNVSTSTVRLVCSTEANLYAAISAGICALWGPLHGGANERVVEMLHPIHKEGKTPEQIIARAVDKQDNFRLAGVGHRIYKTYDPRAKIAKDICYQVLERLHVNDPLLDIAIKLEEKILAHPYFQERKLFPNVDFYTGITYRAMGFPTNMYTVLFALGRLPGWIAQWMEFREDPGRKLGRPTQLYTGDIEREFIPIDRR